MDRGRVWKPWAMLAIVLAMSTAVALPRLARAEEGDVPPEAQTQETEATAGADEGLELEAAAPIKSGTCGNVDWTLTSFGTLDLDPKGDGTMDDWGSTPPWEDVKDKIESVMVHDGTSVIKPKTCKNMFKGCANLEYVTLDRFDNTTAKTCEGMFSGCDSLVYFERGEQYDNGIAGAFPDNPYGGAHWLYINLESGVDVIGWTPMSKITGTLRTTFAAYDARCPMDRVNIDAIPDQEYTGSAITPKLTVTVADLTLSENSGDYTVTWKDNVNVGTATATIEGTMPFMGTKWVTFKIVPSSSSKKWQRLWGATALDTMAKVVQADGVFADNRGKSVVVATSEGYWDALAASAFAGSLADGAPVLITPTNSLAAQTKAELERLKPEWIFVMGGPAAISEATFAEIEKYAPGKTERIAGATAADTAVEIYRKPPTWKSDTAIIATSNGYWDALSIAPYAYHSGSPIFLTTYDASVGGQVLGSEAYSSLNIAKIANHFTRIVIVGGTAAISEGVETQLKGMGYTSSQIIRLAGATALDTSAKIAEWELKSEQGMGLTHMGVATNDGYWDALTGAALCGQQGSVLVLVGKTGGYTAFDAVYQPSKVVGGYVFGGKAAVSEESYAYITTK